MDLNLDTIKTKAKERPLDVAVIIVIILVLFFVARPLVQKSDPAIAQDKAATDVLTQLSGGIGNSSTVSLPEGVTLLSGTSSPTGPKTILASGTAASLAKKGEPWAVCNRSESKKYFCIISNGTTKSYGSSFGFLAARIAGKPNF